MSDNPLLTESPLPFGCPPFDRICPEHFEPAFDEGMRRHREEVEAIAESPAEPTFENILVALERSGRLLRRVSLIFGNLVSAHTSDELQALRSAMAPKLARHRDDIYLNASLFDRIESVHTRQDEFELRDEDQRLLERRHADFVRAGARLEGADRRRLREINEELAELTTQFAQNVLAEVNESAVLVDDCQELAGLTEAEIETAAEAARERGNEGKFLLPLVNTTGQPVLASLRNRELRRRIHESSVSRGRRGNEYDNREILVRVVRLRAERAQLLGYGSHANFRLEDQMAGSPGAVLERLRRLAGPAVRNARAEARRLQSMIDEEGDDFRLAPWDWACYAERVREAEYDFDESDLKPFLELDRVLQDGAFRAAGMLFGIGFRERYDLPTYHPDVRVFDVREEDGTPFGLFLLDPYARPEKRGGAWNSSYVKQSTLTGDAPVIANHLNLTRPAKGEPTLLTFDEVSTLFHEFGHALHGLFSRVTYPYFSGTSVPRDFVEFPSQVNEMWSTRPEILREYAVHHRTGEPMPEELVERVLATRTFNQGFRTTEYLAAALLDQAWHRLSPEEVPDADGIEAFEARALEEAGVALEVVPPRYHSTYFSHIMGGYSACYYSYIWAEVMDADAVEWFEEHGGPSGENGARLRETVLSRGGSVDPMEQYRDFRGRDARVEPLLERRGLVES